MDQRYLVISYQRKKKKQCILFIHPHGHRILIWCLQKWTLLLSTNLWTQMVISNLQIFFMRKWKFYRLLKSAFIYLLPSPPTSTYFKPLKIKTIPQFIDFSILSYIDWISYYEKRVFAQNHSGWRISDQDYQDTMISCIETQSISTQTPLNSKQDQHEESSTAIIAKDKIG